MNYLQALFSIFNAPLFATFIIGMFWKRMTPAAGFWGLVAGTIAAAARTSSATRRAWIDFGSDLDELWGAGLAFVVDAVVTVVVTLVTQPKPVEELQGLVYGMANVDESASADEGWWRVAGAARRRRARSARRPDHRLLVGERHGDGPVATPTGPRPSIDEAEAAEADAARPQPVRPAPRSSAACSRSGACC